MFSPECPRDWTKVAATAATAAASDAEVEEELAAVLEDMVSGKRTAWCFDLVLGEKKWLL